MYLYLCNLQLKLKTKIMITKTVEIRNVSYGQAKSSIHEKTMTIKLFRVLIYKSNVILLK